MLICLPDGPRVGIVNIAEGSLSFKSLTCSFDLSVVIVGGLDAVGVDGNDDELRIKYN